MEKEVKKIDLKKSRLIEVELIQDMPSARKKKGDKIKTLPENVEYLKSVKLIK